ncbi:MAG TPA: ThuA domain-containing protein [Polyangiaceae bacterium]|nr:ThuA domain-containing protein [Polyangiaceae bacterium]
MNRLPFALTCCLVTLACGNGSPPAKAASPNGTGGTVNTATGGAGTSGGAADASGGSSNTPVHLLIFTRTLGYRHPSIDVGIGALTGLGAARGWQVDSTDDPSRFSDAGLAAFNVVLFLSTTGDVLDDAQQLAMQRFIRARHGFVGVHSASDTEYDWPWYGELVGAYFSAHPAIQEASVIVETKNHPATAALSSPWLRTDEWYGFRSNPRANATILLRLDESSYDPAGTGMGEDHPIAWAHEFEGGRALYTALGHTDESYQEPEFLAHLAGAVEWAAQ